LTGNFEGQEERILTDDVVCQEQFERIAPVGAMLVSNDEVIFNAIVKLLEKLFSDQSALHPLHRFLLEMVLYCTSRRVDCSKVLLKDIFDAMNYCLMHLNYPPDCHFFLAEESFCGQPEIVNLPNDYKLEVHFVAPVLVITRDRTLKVVIYKQRDMKSRGMLRVIHDLPWPARRNLRKTLW
jgi:hypothetical protein